MPRMRDKLTILGDEDHDNTEAERALKEIEKAKREVQRTVSAKEVLERPVRTMKTNGKCKDYRRVA